VTMPLCLIRLFRGRAVASSLAVGVLAIVSTVTATRTIEAQTARTWFVATTGDDSAAGTVLQPLRTIQRAADLVNPGDTVIVEDGTYTGTGVGTACGSNTRPVVCLTRGGNSTAWVTFRARNFGAAKIDGQSNTSTDGFRFLANANYIQVFGFEVFGVGNAAGSSSGFEMYNGGHDVVIAENDVHDVGRLCTDTSNGEVGVFVEQPRVTITRNTIHDIGRFINGENGCSTSYAASRDHGVYVNGQATNSAIPGAADASITDNVFYRNQRGWSVQIYPGIVASLSILNNTFAFPNPYQDGHIILGASTSNSRIENNIFYKPKTAAISFYTGTQTNLQITNNIVYGGSVITSVPAGTTLTANQLTDPLLLNATITPYDFHLNPMSAAIAKGVTLPEVPVDHDGVLRPTGIYDLGAYQTVSGTMQTVAMPTITPGGGQWNATINVTLGTATPGAIIHYTTDGTTPTALSTTYNAPFTLSASGTVQAVAMMIGWYDSPVAQALFQIQAQADTVLPTVSFLSPQDGATVPPNGNVSFSVAASDNVRVASVRFDVDGRTIATDTSAPYSASYNFKKAAKGAHLVTATAVDDSGNKLSKSITVWR
jgi:Bacterial Ig domain/Chitobiase/beta-hexosaminidase C-terminal domain/Protein of unknown function (DUF1565)